MGTLGGLAAWFSLAFKSAFALLGIGIFALLFNPGLSILQIKIIAVGKTKEGWIKEGTAHYEKLLRGYAELQLLELQEEKITRSRRPESILETEAERILKILEHSHSKGPLELCLALDVSGRHLSSDGFARLLEQNLGRGYSRFNFVIGGALGLSRKVLDSCSANLSLSPMTFTHEMSRIILLEQIYRAFSILKGTGYHK